LLSNKWLAKSDFSPGNVPYTFSKMICHVVLPISYGNPDIEVEYLSWLDHLGQIDSQLRF